MVLVSEHGFEDDAFGGFNINSNVEITTDHPHNGVKGVKDDGVSTAYIGTDATDGESGVYVRFYFKLHTDGGSPTDREELCQVYKQGAPSYKLVDLVIYKDGSGDNWLAADFMNDSSPSYGWTGDVVDATTEIVVGTWYCVEVYAGAGTSGTHKVWLNGVEIMSEAYDFSGNPMTVGSTFLFAVGYTYSMFSAIDDCKIDTSRISCLGTRIGTINDPNIIYWNEIQVCNPAIRDVPTREDGAFVDTGTFTLKNRKIRITLRLSDAEKTVMQSLFDENANCAIVVQCETGTDYPRWTYTAWFTDKKLQWKYRKESGTEKPWVVELEFVCTTFAYETS